MNRSEDKILDELIECSSPLISRPLHGCDAMELQRFKSTASSQCEHEPPNHDEAVEEGQIPESSDSPSKSDESCRTRSLVSKTTQCPGGSGSCSPSTPTSPVRATTSTSPTHTHTSPTHSPPSPKKAPTSPTRAPTSPTRAPTSPTRAPTSPTRAPPKSNTCESCGQLMKLPDVKTQSINSISSSHSSSHSSHSSSHSSVVDVCRICHCEVDNELGPLIAPCKCKGTLEFVHQSCLQQWIKSSDYKHCELCGFHFAMDSKLKPITKWEKLTMSTSERRKLICSVMFHIIAITCVVWSLYVLIERTAAELKSGDLYWPFWTKLVVVAIGFTGGLVFMYVQCKVYVQLWKRLKAFNRIIYVQNQPPNTEILKSTSQPPTNAAEDSHRNNTSSTNPHRNSITSQCDINVIVEICDPPMTPVTSVVA